MPKRKKTDADRVREMEAFNATLQVSEKRVFTDEERDAIETFLKERRFACLHTIDSVSEFYGPEPDEMRDNLIKYWRWTEACIKWMISTVRQFGANGNASNSSRRKDERSNIRD